VIWLLFGAMLLAAALAVTWPMYRVEKRVTRSVIASVVVVLGVSAVIYSSIGTPVPPEPVASLEDAAAALEERLQEHAADIEGWKMLGRSYMQLQNYSKAITAFEKVAELEAKPTAQTMASLGEALLIEEGSASADRVSQLFESALSLEPANPKALFYGGIIAIERGNRDLAADRWEALLALSPPPEIEDVLRQRVAEWRGEIPAVTQAGPASSEAIVAVNVSLAPGAASAVAPDATVFIIARDPAQPSPPIAAARRRVSELPAQVSLSDADAMIPGRPLSAFDELEIVARVSMSGGPAAQTGDWYGEHTVSQPGSAPVDIVIGKQVP
jgi:cytochrome c-type biogenesis protein CcmH